MKPPVASLLLGIAMLACVAVSARAGEGCTCRAPDGSDVAEGQTACIKSPAGPVLARCGKVLNNTSWMPLGLPCPQAAITPRPQAGGLPG